jgi:hypothetical protein
MVWIYGGGDTQGSGADSTFDGASLASRSDVVVFTFNVISSAGIVNSHGTDLRLNSTGSIFSDFSRYMAVKSRATI